MEGSEAPVAKPRRFIGRRAAEALQQQRQQQRDKDPATTTPGAVADTAVAAVAEGAVVTRATPAKRFVKQQVPDDILFDEALNEAITVLPANYNFEIHKTVARVRSLGARRVALQFPEGLLMYACTIADILEQHAGVEHCMVLGDVTYGACCVDDFSAKALGADLLVHYGHSCLVPVDVTKVPCMYVFVDIGVDVRHLVATVRANFRPGATLSLAGTIQFGSSIQAARQQLVAEFPSLRVAQARPLSPGEVLGCTAPVVPPDTEAIVFVADGRFHLEAIMIANPALPAFRYDPYAREMTLEQYDQAGMRAARRKAVLAAAPARHWGVVLGTLGRQGNPRLVSHLEGTLARHGRTTLTVLLSEVLPSKLAMFQGIDAWVQVACPRLSIDWGEAFVTPTLTPYEALVALGEVPPWWEQAPAAPRPPQPTPLLLQPLRYPEGQQQNHHQQQQQQQDQQQNHHHHHHQQQQQKEDGSPVDHKHNGSNQQEGQQQQQPQQLQAQCTPDQGPPDQQLQALCTPDQGPPDEQLRDLVLQEDGAKLDALHQLQPQLQLQQPRGSSCGESRGIGGHTESTAPSTATSPISQQQQNKQEQQQRQQQRVDAYPMDYYAKDGGVWGSYYPQAAGGGAAGKLAAMRAAKAAQLQAAA